MVDMDSNEHGLKRELARGDYVILSTGAIGRARQAYPAGYDGIVEIEIDDQSMSERAGTLVLPDGDARERPQAIAGDVFEHHSQDEAHTREPDKRMRD